VDLRPNDFATTPLWLVGNPVLNDARYEDGGVVRGGDVVVA
jgi:hypothetical protein